MLAARVNPRVVMEVLGHSQISVTMNAYSHVSTSTATDAGCHGRDALREGPDIRPPGLGCCQVPGLGFLDCLLRGDRGPAGESPD